MTRTPHIAGFLLVAVASLVCCCGDSVLPSVGPSGAGATGHDGGVVIERLEMTHRDEVDRVEAIVRVDGDPDVGRVVTITGGELVTDDGTVPLAMIIPEGTDGYRGPHTVAGRGDIVAPAVDARDGLVSECGASVEVRVSVSVRPRAKKRGAHFRPSATTEVACPTTSDRGSQAG